MNKETGGPAFPINIDSEMTCLGITARDYFAAKAMQSLMWDKDLDLDNRADVAEVAYSYADEMLKARSI